jgi:hypothetical protein
MYNNDGRPDAYVALTLLWISTSSIPAILLSAEPLLTQRMLLVSKGTGGRSIDGVVHARPERDWERHYIMRSVMEYQVNLRAVRATEK